MDSPFPLHLHLPLEKQQDNEKLEEKEAEEEQVEEELKEGYEPIPAVAPKGFKKGLWLRKMPSSIIYNGKVIV